MRRLESLTIALVAVLLTAVPAFFTDAIDGPGRFPQTVPDWLGWIALVVACASLG